MEESSNSLADLESLVGIFFPKLEQLGDFEAVDAIDVPEPQNSLLNHNHHMTVTVEKFHSSPVDVEVLNSTSHASEYSREILLRRSSDRGIVQYGIVRLHFEFLSEQVRTEIQKRQTPLGRILISHNVMRQVKLLSLYKIRPGERLAEFFGPEKLCFGRTALIYCDDQPAIELLEIITA